MLSNTCVVKSVSSKARYFRQSLFMVLWHLSMAVDAASLVTNRLPHVIKNSAFRDVFIDEGHGPDSDVITN